jgi:isopenicillin-N N-acyltransferase-like protein
MQIRTFEGNFHEIGRQMGRIYKANGTNLNKVEIDTDLFENQLRIYEKYYPEYLEELQGMADGGDFDQQKMIYNTITGEIFFFKNMIGMGRACTIFGYKTEKGLFVGRNYDWLPVPNDLFEVYKVRNSERNSYIAVTDYGIVNPDRTAPKYRAFLPEDTINDKGLFVGLTFSFADQWSYGISSIHIVKLIAETCGTVDDALALFERIPACCPKRYFIADRFGNMVTVEHTSKRYKVVYPKENVLIQTNHYLDPELAEEDTVLKKIPYHNTYIRYYETLQRINFQREKFNFNSIIWIMGKPGTYTCQNFPGIKTIWTLALDMTGGKYRIYWDPFGQRKSKELKF